MNLQHHELPLIRTKLAPPRASPTRVERSSLLQQLDGWRHRKLSLVTGPAGSGKTMLLTQWRKQLVLGGAAVAWYNAGADDDDVHVAAYIVESLRQAGVPLADEALRLYLRSGGKAWKHLLAALINDFGPAQREVYLFIDDFHYLASFGILQLIDRWLALAPASFHLVLGTRVRPPLDLARLRAEDQLNELRFEQLRFEPGETRRFVDAQGLSQLSAAEVASLQEITDGWAAGLQLLTFSLRHDKQPGGFLQRQSALSLSQEGALSAYLEKAAIEHLSEAELYFLTRISACRRFNRELCQLLTGDPQAAQHLAKFESQNLFLLSIDTADAEPWYRFHRMFASFLNQRLSRLAAPELRRLHQLASHWFADRDLHIEALRHASLAQDPDFLIELIDRAARRMTNGAQYLEFLNWCDKLPPERLKTRINVQLCAALAQLSCGRTGPFDRTIADIEQHPAYSMPDVRMEVRLLKAYRFMRHDDTAAQLEAVAEVQREPPARGSIQHLLLCSVAGFGLVYANQFEAARELVRARHRQGRGHFHAVPLVDVIQGFSHLMQGNIRLAADQLAPVFDTAFRITALGADAAGLIVGYLIEAHYQLDQLDTARELLERHQELIDAVSAADSVLFGYRVRARIERLDGDAAVALRTLQRLEEIGYRLGLDRLVAWSLYDQAGLAIEMQEGAALRDLMGRLNTLAMRYQGHSDCVWSEIPLAALIARADVAFAQAEPGLVLQALAAAESAAASSGRQLLLLKLGFMRSITTLRQGQATEALPAARALVRSAAECGALRVLADLGAAARPLLMALQESPTSEAESEYLRRSRRPTDDNSSDLLHGESVNDASLPVREQGTPLLSIREREVLDLLSKALSNKSIARALDLSPGTVKWHLKNIYGKLLAVSREDALAKARKLKVIA
jgi:LuxR family maltose regulon positive regulatory protein